MFKIDQNAILCPGTSFFFPKSDIFQENAKNEDTIFFENGFLKCYKIAFDLFFFYLLRNEM